MAAVHRVRSPRRCGRPPLTAIELLRRRAYHQLPQPGEYSSKVQQQCRTSAPFNAASPRSTSVSDAHRWRGRHFASKGLGVRVPLAPLSHLVSVTFSTRRNFEIPEYSSKVQQRRRRVVMLSGLRAARRASSTLSKSRRWSLGCIHPSSPRSGCGAVSAATQISGRGRVASDAAVLR
jgi:hypothetical protein